MIKERRHSSDIINGKTHSLTRRISRPMESGNSSWTII
jgi:hypothetical protein